MLNSCVGKVNEDNRTITKSPMLYRATMAADEEIKEWELSHSDPFDTAQVGASALLAALKRNLRAEIASWLGQHCISVFNDFNKFFDSLDIPRVSLFSFVFLASTTLSRPNENNRFLVGN